MTSERRDTSENQGEVKSLPTFTRGGLGGNLLEIGLRGEAFKLPTQAEDRTLSFLNDRGIGAFGLDGFGLINTRERNDAPGATHNTRDRSAARGDSHAERTPEIGEDASADKRREFVEKPVNRQSAAVASLWNDGSRILQIGDAHFANSIKDWTAQNMQEFRKQGAEGFGMEFVPKSMQGDVDAYANTRRTGTSKEISEAREKLYDKWALEQRTPDQVDLNSNDGRAKENTLRKQFGLIDAAIDAGLRPIGIEPEVGGLVGLDDLYSNLRDVPASAQKSFDQYNQPDLSPDARAAAREDLSQNLSHDWNDDQRADFFKRLDQVREAGMDLNGVKVPAPQDNDDWTARFQEMRNKHWTAASANYLDQNPEKKLVMFAGSAHFGYGKSDIPNGQIETTTDKLRARGHRSTVLQFAGGDQAKLLNKPDDVDDHDWRKSFWQSHPNEGVDTREKNLPMPPDTAQFASQKWTKTIDENPQLRTQQFAFRMNRERARQGDFVVHLRPVE